MFQTRCEAGLVGVTTDNFPSKHYHIPLANRAGAKHPSIDYRQTGLTYTTVKTVFASSSTKPPITIKI